MGSFKPLAALFGGLCAFGTARAGKRGTDPWDCSVNHSQGIVGKKCDYVIIDKYFHNNMTQVKMEQKIIDTFKGKPTDKDSASFGPCRDFRATYYRADGGYVAAGQRADGSFSDSGYVDETGCKVIKFNWTSKIWQMKYVCDGLDEENYVQWDGFVDSGGRGVREFPMSNWGSREQTCIVAVQGVGSGDSCVKSGAGHTCGRVQEAVCRQGGDKSQPEKAAGTACEGGGCQPSLDTKTRSPIPNTMTCVPQVVFDCHGKVAGDACPAGVCKAVSKYTSAKPRFYNPSETIICCKDDGKGGCIGVDIECTASKAKQYACKVSSLPSSSTTSPSLAGTQATQKPSLAGTQATQTPSLAGTTTAPNTTKGRQSEVSHAALMHPSLVVVSSVLMFLEWKV